MLGQGPELFTSFIKKQTGKLYQYFYSFVKDCEHLEDLISVQTLLLFDYTGSIVANSHGFTGRLRHGFGIVTDFSRIIKR